MAAIPVSLLPDPASQAPQEKSRVRKRAFRSHPRDEGGELDIRP